jgi:hypothetical protein
MEPFRQCLLALPSLRALGIMDHKSLTHGIVESVFKNKPDFPNIKKVTIPGCIHVMLPRFPGMEELVCYRCPAQPAIFQAVMRSTRVYYARANDLKVEPVLKSVSAIGLMAEGFTKGTDPPHGSGFMTLELIPRVHTVLVSKFSRIRKVCLTQVCFPSRYHPYPPPIVHPSSAPKSGYEGPTRSREGSRNRAPPL